MSGLVRARDDDRPPATDVPVDRSASYIVWPATDSNLLTAPRSFVQDMASRNAVSRRKWR